MFLSGCGTPLPPPTSPAPGPTSSVEETGRLAFVWGPAETALPAMILAERRAAAGGDLETLAVLWAEDGRVVDARRTADVADDYRWEGRRDVLERYVVDVFPYYLPPPGDVLEPYTLQIMGNGATVAVAGDRWRFTFDGERWWLQELIFHHPEN